MHAVRLVFLRSHARVLLPIFCAAAACALAMPF